MEKILFMILGIYIGVVAMLYQQNTLKGAMFRIDVLNYEYRIIWSKDCGIDFNLPIDSDITNGKIKVKCKIK